MQSRVSMTPCLHALCVASEVRTHSFVRRTSATVQAKFARGFARFMDRPAQDDVARFLAVAGEIFFGITPGARSSQREEAFVVELIPSPDPGLSTVTRAPVVGATWRIDPTKCRLNVRTHVASRSQQGSRCVAYVRRPHARPLRTNRLRVSLRSSAAGSGDSTRFAPGTNPRCGCSR